MAQTATTQSFWRKKEVVSYLLSVLVFFTHISTFYNYRNIGQLTTPVYIFWQFMSNFLTPFAVPLFFIISGALFYRDYNRENYVPKLKSRFRSLLLPYLLWNTLWMLFDILCSYTPISSLFLGRTQFTLSVGNVLEAIVHYGRNLPFWFIFALMIFVLAAPLIDLLLRNKYVGLVVILSVWVLSLYGIGLPKPLFYKHNSLFYYLIGAFVGKHCFSFFQTPKKRWLQILSLFVSAAVPIILFKFLPKGWNVHLKFALCDALLLSAAAAVWFAADLYSDVLGRFRFTESSFAVFALHVNVSAVVTKLLFFVLPKNGTGAIFNFLLTVIFTLSIIALIHRSICTYLPKLAELIFGHRASKQLRKD